MAEYGVLFNRWSFILDRTFTAYFVAHSLIFIYTIYIFLKIIITSSCCQTVVQFPVPMASFSGRARYICFAGFRCYPMMVKKELQHQTNIEHRKH